MPFHVPLFPVSSAFLKGSRKYMTVIAFLKDREAEVIRNAKTVAELDSTVEVVTTDSDRLTYERNNIVKLEIVWR